MHLHIDDPYRPGNSPVHTLDPRLKVVWTLVGLTSIGLTQTGDWGLYLVWLALLLLVCLAAELGMLYTIKRSYLALPFVLPAGALLITTPGSPLIPLPWFGLSISSAGFELTLSILVRSWLAVQFAVLLTTTTRFPDLLWGLSSLGVPGPLLSIFSFAYRYLFVLGDEALRMIRARSSRTVALPGVKAPPWMWRARVTGGMVGTLFLRALSRSERVFRAMQARGYEGEILIRQPPEVRVVEWGVVITFSLLMLVVPLFSRFG